MKKLVILTLVLVMLASVCFAEDATGTYKIYNGTNEKLTELYLYPAGSEEKGENLAEGFSKSKTLTYTGASDTVLVLEFVTESGWTGKFETLHIEETPITLLAADAMTGATPIAFKTLEGTGTYKIYNGTNEKLTELYLYPAGSEEKGENYAEGFGKSKTLTYTGAIDSVLVLEFVTESGWTGKFETLHIEETPITLLAADAMTGATPITFKAIEGTGSYTLYNGTNEKLAELYLYAASADETEEAVKGDNLAEDFEDGKVLTYTGAIDTVLVLEFVTESGYAGSFTTLHIEEAPITLLAADAMTGATAISFFAPQN